MLGGGFPNVLSEPTELARGGMGKADFIEWIKADFREWSKADSTYAASQQTLFIVSGSPSSPILGEVI